MNWILSSTSGFHRCKKMSLKFLKRRRYYIHNKVDGKRNNNIDIPGYTDNQVKRKSVNIKGDNDNKIEVKIHFMLLPFSFTRLDNT